MIDFKESLAKQIIRDLILENAKELRPNGYFTYFGLPGSQCLDISLWKDNIKYAYCCEKDSAKFDFMMRTLHRLIPGKSKSLRTDIWEVMGGKFEHFIDLCNFDFFGGPSSSEIPEIKEFNSLTNFFANQREKDEKSFLIAWTFGVRNPNFKFYKDAIINFMKEIHGNKALDYKRLEKWLSANNKMIKSYIYYVPCMTYNYAQSARFDAELIDSCIYKKIMYFCLMKIIPSKKQISREQRIQFFNEIFQKQYIIYDKNCKLDRIESLPIKEMFT